MTPEEYIQAALRTEPSSYGFSETNGISPRLEHAILGITTEAGELLDVVKKAKIYGKPFDRAHVAEELGDVFWYSAVLADELGVSFEEIWKKNILKLQARYPEKYEHSAALNRDLDSEVKAMENV